MIIKKRSVKALFLAAALAAIAVIPLSACKDENDGPVNTDKPSFTFLKAEGESVKNADGEEVYLRGVNAGGLFVTEHWMTGFAYTTPSNDYKSLTQTFIERFGEDKTKKLWAEYRANWWTELDFQNCAEMGMNVIRLPFTYMNVDFDALKVGEDGEQYKYAGVNYDFSDLDAFVEGAAEYGMYTILDLHGAYGSHNGQDHSGEIIGNASAVDFYSNRQKKDLTIKLWSELSKHFKDNPHVAGYDILNEPGEKAGITFEPHWAFYDEVYRAIRQTGDEHIVILESCWDGKDLPAVSRYGWKNCMYSFHHYSNNNKNDEENILAHGISWNEKIEDITNQNFGVPINMGEFTSYTSAGKWEYTLDLLNRLNWHWTSWTYKIWGNMPWGVVNVRGDNADKVDAVADEYEDILKKFKKLRTDGDAVKKYTFSSRDEQGLPITLESVLQRFCTAPAQTERLEEGDYLFYSDAGYLSANGMAGGKKVLNFSEDFYTGITVRISYHPSNDGSAYITYNSQRVGVLTLGGTKYLNLNSPSNTNDVSARFSPVKCGEGWAFVSLSACKYLTVDENGLLCASASTIDDAVVFNIY